MKKVLILGLTDLAEVLIYHLEHSQEYHIEAVTAERGYIPSDKVGGLLLQKYPIIPFENIEESYSPQQYSFFVCIGYSKMNEGRKNAFNKIRGKGYEILTFTHPTALVQGEEIGRGNLFFENVTVGAYCKIGDGNIFYPCSHVAHHTDVGDFNFFAVSSSVAGHVRIGSQCFCGNQCSTKNGIVIADRTLLGAGAYLEQNTSEGDVIVPARSIVIDKRSDDIMI